MDCCKNVKGFSQSSFKAERGWDIFMWVSTLFFIDFEHEFPSNSALVLQSIEKRSSFTLEKMVQKFRWRISEQV